MNLKLYFTIFSLILIKKSEEKSYENLIQEEIFDKFQFLPPFPSNNSILIKVSLNVMGLEHVNTKEGSVTLQMTLILKWTDPTVSWDPTKFNNIAKFTYRTDNEESKIWLPDLVPMEVAEMPLKGLKKTRLHIYSNGTIISSRFGVVKIKHVFDLVGLLNYIYLKF